MYPFAIDPEVVAIFIPIIVVLGVFASVITGIVVGGKRKELAHRERVLAIEKGMPLPEEPKVEKRPAYLTLRAWGIVLALLGAALVIAIGVAAGAKHGVWGLPPAAIGIAMLIAASMEKKDAETGAGRVE